MILSKTGGEKALKSDLGTTHMTLKRKHETFTVLIASMQ